MLNETLSVSQAKKILDELDEALVSVHKKLVEKNGVFVDKLVNSWEDNNAVRYMGEHVKKLGEVQVLMHQCGEKYMNMLEDIANSYLKVSGSSERFYYNRIPGASMEFGSFSSQGKKVKEFFGDGNGDDFGFKDVKGGTDQILQSFDEFASDVSVLEDQLGAAIRGINAFGNQNVQNNLAKSGSDLVYAIGTRIHELRKAFSTYLEDSASRYTQVGSNSETSAKISSNSI